MIDNPVTATALLEDMTAALPTPARLTPETLATLRAGELGPAVPADCQVVALRYLDDLAGILCKLDFGPAVTNTAFVSLTHLRFDPRLPLARRIAAYQKHRVKKLRRGPR